MMGTALDAESKPVTLALVAVHDKIMARYDDTVRSIKTAVRDDYRSRLAARAIALKDAAADVRAVLGASLCYLCYEPCFESSGVHLRCAITENALAEVR